MASNRPWYQRNGGEFIVGTMHMDLETRGAYSLIIDMLNDRDRAIPDEPRFIAGFLNISVRKWKSIRETLLADSTKLYIDSNGNLTNPRFEKERRLRLGIHEASVEHGRVGGLKSAALRQGTLPLNPTFSEFSTLEKSPRVEHKLPVSDTAELKNKDKIQPPPQPSRARQSPEIRINQSNESNLTQLDARENSEPIDRSDDLMKLFERVSAAAGYAPTSAVHISQSIDLIKAWRDLGADFDATVIPTIETIMRQTEDRTSSLKRFDAQIRLAVAKHSAIAKQGAPPQPPQPIFQFEDEDPRFIPIRQDLLKALGPIRYARHCHSARLSAPIRVNGVATLQITDRVPSMRLLDDDRGGIVKAIAKRHGFEDVW